VAVVETVRGPVDLGNLGQTLMHEHVYVLSTEHASRGYAASMVLAHDANCFIDYFGAAHDAARAAAAPNWHYEHITDDVLPALLADGVTQEQIDTMMVENPVRYFTPAKGGAS
jgi:predicted metal-dependent phosphotriesterase family hydrolase